MSFEFEESVKKYRCLRCGYEWIPRKSELPKVCANKKCKSPYWNIPRGQKKGPKVAGQERGER